MCQVRVLSKCQCHQHQISASQTSQSQPSQSIKIKINSQCQKQETRELFIYGLVLSVHEAGRSGMPVSAYMWRCVVSILSNKRKTMSTSPCLSPFYSIESAPASQLLNLNNLSAMEQKWNNISTASKGSKRFGYQHLETAIKKVSIYRAKELY